MSSPRPPCLRSRSIALALAALNLLHCETRDPLEDAQQYLAAGRYPEALEILTPLIEEGSSDPHALFLYGRSQHRSGRPALALASLHQARRYEGWEVSAGLALAGAAHDARAWPTAIEAADFVIEREPENVQAYRLRAQARIEAREDLELALADIDHALELDPGNPTLLLGRVGVLLSLERIDEAAEILGQIDEIATSEEFSVDQRAGFCVARATFLREHGEADTATTVFEECLESYPLAPTVVVATVEHFDRVGRPERSNEIFRELVESMPLEFVPRAQLARRLHTSGQTEEAEALLLEGGGLPHPLSAAYALSTLVELYAQENRYAEAAALFQRVRELEGDAGPQRILVHAELLALAGEREQALALAEALGDHVYRHIVRAVVAFEDRDARSALEHLEEALVEWPDNAAAQYYAGRAAERLGNFERAADAYRNSIRSGAENTDAGLRLARLHNAQRRYREAIVATGHHLKEHGQDLEAAILAVELGARLDEKSLQGALSNVPGEHAWGRVAALLSDIIAERSGAAAAVTFLRADPRIDLTTQRDAEAVEALVRHLRADDQDAESRRIAGELAAQNPDDARLQWTLSLANDGDAARAARDRALTLDPTLAPALLARAREAAQAGEPKGVIASIDALESPNPAAQLEAAQLLAAVGATQRAEASLEDQLWERPYDAGVARMLARLRLDRGEGTTPRTLELARRAATFDAGPEAKALLDEVRSAQGESEGGASSTGGSGDDR